MFVCREQQTANAPSGAFGGGAAGALVRPPLAERVAVAVSRSACVAHRPRRMRGRRLWRMRARLGVGCAGAVVAGVEPARASRRGRRWCWQRRTASLKKGRKPQWGPCLSGCARYCEEIVRSARSPVRPPTAVVADRLRMARQSRHHAPRAAARVAVVADLLRMERHSRHHARVAAARSQTPPWPASEAAARAAAARAPASTTQTAGRHGVGDRPLSCVLRWLGVSC